MDAAATRPGQVKRSVAPRDGVATERANEVRTTFMLPSLLPTIDEPLCRAALVDVDATLFIIIALFLALYLFLRFALFRPVLRLFEERERRIEGAKQEARDMQDRAAKALAQYEEFVREARAQGAAEKEALRQEGQRVARALIDEVRKETAAEIAKGRAVLQAEIADATASIDREAEVLAREAATRLLGRPVQTNGRGMS
jgi:F-type H+-transporting ATPase subunit b